MNLAGKRIVVTGAFGSLGKQVVTMALAAGAKVAAVDYAPAEGQQQQDGLVLLGGADLTSVESAQAAFAEAKQQLGGIDGLVNIAGGFAWETFAGSGVDTWDKMYNINLRTAVIACQSAVPFMLEETGAAIVNISANSALMSEMGVAAYTASKAGVAKLTESLADEFKAKIRVNAVLPTIIDTPVNRNDMPDADYSAWVSPQELGNVILFLLSPEASAVTGALLPVKGRV